MEELHIKRWTYDVLDCNEEYPTEIVWREDPQGEWVKADDVLKLFNLLNIREL